MKGYNLFSNVEPNSWFRYTEEKYPLTRDELWDVLDTIQKSCVLTPAAERMVKLAKRAKYNYLVTIDTSRITARR